ncbi:MAG TPA: DUF58 domain-containing protein [Longimicrobiales bacterium]
MRTAAATTSAPGARFIDPRVLARIANLELVARTVVEGFINGLHRSPYLGLSLDFAEHRAYMPGDDIRRIDWRLYARTDRFYVKQFEADTNANFSLLVDVSKSMAYGREGIPKLDYARFLAACLAYFSQKQRDRVGLATFDSDVVDYVPPAAGHFDIVMHTLDRTRPGGAGNLRRPLEKLAENYRRRGILVLVSDLYEEPVAVRDAVRRLRNRGNDLIVFHILDRAELEFPFQDAANFEDLESGTRIPVIPDHVRARYRELIANHVAELQRLLGEDRVDYTLIDTSTPLDQALFSYLATRERLTRVR